MTRPSSFPEVRELAPDHRGAVQQGKIYVKMKQYKEGRKHSRMLSRSTCLSRTHDGLADASQALGAKEIAAKKKSLPAAHEVGETWK
jgi:hypothetical protein